MDDMKELVTATLAKQGVLANLRAELRTAVFAAIEEQEHVTKGQGLSQRTKNANRAWLLGTEEGVTLAGLVKEFHSWCNLHFTQKVYEPELDLGEELATRKELMHQLWMTEDDDQPLLLTIMQFFLLHNSHSPVQQEAEKEVELLDESGAQVPRSSQPAYAKLSSTGQPRAEIMQRDSSMADRSEEEDIGRFSPVESAAVPGYPLIKAVHSSRSLRFGELGGAGDEVGSYRAEEHVVLTTAKEAFSLPAPGARSEGTSSAAASLASSPVRKSRGNPDWREIGEVSPVRKSVEELKKQLQSQGMLLTSPFSSPERARTGGSDVEASED